MSSTKARILVVEDDAALRRSVVLSLAKFGFDVVEAADGLAALEVFETTPIEAMVVDGKMPLLDGFGTCERIRAHPRGKTMPILLVTGMSEAQAIEQAYAAGATDFILKPINLSVLAHRLKHMIENARLQAALSSTRSTLEAFIGAIPSAVIFCDRNWQLMEANVAAEAMFGWGQEELEGLPAHALFTDSESCKKLKTALAHGAVSVPQECELTNAAEKPFWAEIVGAPVGADHEGLLGWVLVMTDATERRKTRLERERTAKLDLMGLLAGGIAHDFNNILTAVLSSVTLAQLEVEPNCRAAVYLNDAQPALDQAKRLSQQLLTFSKGGTPVLQLTNIRTMLKQTVEFSLRGTKVAPVFDLPEDAWLAQVDQGQLVQVISNLVVNAQQAMSRGGQLWVQMNNINLPPHNAHKLEAGSYVAFSVRDEGCGIAPEIISRIFDPYFTTKATGNGLGLATVLSIVQRHKGTIKVDSVVGEGTTFTVFLPAQPLKATVEMAPAKPVAAVEATKARKVLLLEDQELIRQAVSKLLEKAGCTVEACETGEAALEAYQAVQGAFDAVILDMTLPGGMSGLETFNAMKAINPAIYAIVSTGYADDPVMAQPELYGFSGILPKPYTFDALKKALEAVHC